MPIPTLFAGVAATWIAYLVGMWLASKRGRAPATPSRTTASASAPVDLVGLPIGVLTQLVLVPLVYLPLRELWPDTFSDDRLSENAEKLADRAERRRRWCCSC